VAPLSLDSENAMLELDSERVFPVYKIACDDGCRYVVYNASAIGNPADHVPDKWYFRPYPAPFPIGSEVGNPFETAHEAERAARAPHVLSVGASADVGQPVSDRSVGTA